MNKAFVRESDSDVRYCPFCGSLGQAVGRVTLDALLKPEALQACLRSVRDEAGDSREEDPIAIDGKQVYPPSDERG